MITCTNIRPGARTKNTERDSDLLNECKLFHFKQLNTVTFDFHGFNVCIEKDLRVNNVSQSDGSCEVQIRLLIIIYKMPF